MEPIQIQRVLDYLEANLLEELNCAQIATLMAVSETDLQRSFKMIVGLTISEYIRCRRLTNAALFLSNKENSVLDAALTYGYQTAESFSKAFKQFHGCTPLEAKNKTKPIRYFTPTVVKLAKKGGNFLLCDADYSEPSNSVLAYYEISNEHIRLTKNNHSRIEYLVTMHYLQEVIPPNSRILDCCAGTGVYSFALACKHRVVACDLSARHVQKMMELQASDAVLQGIYQADVCDLRSFESESFDVVLCMGALYHLSDREKQMQAIRECVRVCKKQGIVVFAYLNKWASFYNGIINNLKPMDLLYREFESCNHEDVFFRTTPSEIEEMCSSMQLECIYHIGVDHLSYLSSERIDAMGEKEFQSFLDFQFCASKEPSILGSSLHGLWIGRK